MHDLQTLIVARLRAAIAAALGDAHADTDPLVRPSADARFGDYQANVAMSLGKSLGVRPRDVAEKIVAAIGRDGLFAKVEIAGPGFINLTLTDEAISAQAAAMLADERLGVPAVKHPQRVVIDYSSPNVAKEMAFHHLRSTGIGDVLARVLRFAGHDVVGQNHLGDWGTQFGMLIQNMLEGPAGGDAVSVTQLNAFYQAARKRFDEDPAFAERARLRVVALQAGDAETLARWRELVEVSKRHFDALYARLDIDTADLEYRGESAYNDDLPRVIRELDAAGQLHESEGAKVVFPEGFTGRDGEPMPMIVQKSDGGFLYATTDLAAARYRLKDLRAQRLIYVTDARQAQHFAMVFQVLRQAGWAPETVRLDHVAFGTILGPDRKPFKTRSGETVRLADAIDEAEQRALAIVTEKNPELPDDDRRRIAHVVGVGAMKYADLSSERVKDYTFDWDRALAMEGNTAPYLQNAYVRVRSIFRKHQQATGAEVGDAGAIGVAHPAERALALKLLQLPQVIASVADSLEPHRLCNYLYDVASAYHGFYEKCPVLAAPDEATRESRLRLCDLTARTIRQGLHLLGIGVVEQM
jgi:arginyl-tRNA synthetase